MLADAQGGSRRSSKVGCASQEAAPTLEEVLAAMEQRDARDSGRAVAPLARASDAIEVDSSALTVEAVVAQMLDAVRSGR